MLTRACLAMLLVLPFAEPANATPVWLSAVPLSASSPTASEGADVATDRAGGAIAVWLRGTTVEASTRAAGGPWITPVPLSGAGAVAHSPRVAMDARGDGLVVWTEDRAGGAVVRRRTRVSGGGFSAAADLSGGGTSDHPRAASNVDIAMNDSGAAVVVWQRTTDTDGQNTIQAAVRESVDEEFSVPEPLNDPMAEGSVPRVAIDAAGDAIAVWQGLRVSAATRPAGGAWSAPEDLRDVLHDNNPVVAMQPSGTAIVVWQGNRDPLLSSARAVAGDFASATWSTPAPVGGSYSGKTRVALDTDGTVLVLTDVFLDNTGAIGLYAAPPGAAFTRTGLRGYFSSTSGWGFAAGFHGGEMAYFGYNVVTTVVRPTGGPVGEPQNAAPQGTVLAGRFAVAGDEQGNAIAVWQQHDADGYRVYTSDYDGVAPSISGIDVPDTVPLGATAAMSVSVADRLTGANVSWSFGDGARADGAGVTHTYRSAGPREVTITAYDGVGNTATITRTINVLAPPPVLPKPIDDDGDGFSPPQDCNDDNPNIRPNAREIPGNVVDENCDGRRDPYTQVSATALLTAQYLGHRTTRLIALKVNDVAPGDTVRLTCAGRGCRKAMTHTATIRAAKPLDLTRYIKNAQLHAGAQLKVRITHHEQIARLFTFQMRGTGSGTPRSIRRCQLPTGGALKAC
jgi:hypothetical protein